MVNISLNKVNHFVLRKQHLADDSKIDDIVQIVKDLNGLHATGPTVPFLSLFSRTRAFTRAKLDDELYVKRTMGKIRCMRKTVHIVPQDMIPVAFAATRNLIVPTSAQYAQYLNITPRAYEETSKRILEFVKGEGMTTRGIKKALGVSLNISPIVNLMCDNGLLIRGHPQGGWKSNLHTYYPFGDYFPDLDLNQYDEGTARRLLVKRYLTSFGPVTETDVAWWTGFQKGQVRRIMDELHERVTSVDIVELQATHHLSSSQRMRIASTKPPTTPVITLLPGLDPYIMGYKERERYLDHEHNRFVFDRSGNATSTILLNGRIVGVWDSAAQKERVVKLFLFEQMRDAVMTEIHQQGRHIGQFITGDDVQIQECDAMIPLTRRSAGGFLSPLKNAH
jgi:hypothetical protein